MTTKKIDLILEHENGTTETIQKTIRPMKFRQLNQTLDIVLAIVSVVREDEALQTVFSELWGESKLKKETPPMTIEELEKLSDEELEELDKNDKAAEAEKNRKFMVLVFDSFETLLTHLPAQALELIAAISNIDLELLLDQEIEDVGFEIINAILEVNNFQKIIERGKQSFSIGRTAFTFANKPQIVQ